MHSSASTFSGKALLVHHALNKRENATSRSRAVRISAEKKEEVKEVVNSRREFALNSVSGIFLASMFSFSGTRPSNLGPKNYGNFKQLGLCPPTPNCISTAEEANDLSHYVPQWTYNPPEGRGSKNKATRAQAMAELQAAIENTEPDKFTHEIIKVTDDYLYAEYTSPIFGFVDDVEFYFPPGEDSLVEYRSASRLGESDGDINRKRIRDLRKELQKAGWQSVGF
ncbi:hypothetical protein CYMTET_4667 [Cymbomonas tetramitiformis]|uniref:DUF1499 domain-containing protein n=1 Tax=Cymbomonas tetramitiformis TaxID=36881 RepID=A0AAE0LKA1_9CHLO|nr:hypothetical protein CYMTET_4667 [Cymbomonas tetramitiformis]